jgi:hypothetical protein
VIIYLFRDRKTGNFAVTSDVTGRNLPSLTSSADWIFVEAMGTPRFPPPWEPADFQRLLGWVRADGFYLLDADKEPKNLPAGWVRPRPQ